MTVTERGQFTAKPSGSTCIACGCSGSPTTCSALGTWPPSWARLHLFRTAAWAEPALGRAGDAPDRSLVRHAEGETTFQRSSGSASLIAMSLPVEEMVAVGAAIPGCDLTPPRDRLLVTPPPAAMVKLQRLYAAAARLAEDAPAVIAHPEAARGLEQALIEAVVGCLGRGEVREDRSAQRRHALSCAGFATVEENPDRALYIRELCTAIGVSHRTLRVCCQEQLGMSPKRYLLLRRMHLARRALRDRRQLQQP